ARGGLKSNLRAVPVESLYGYVQHALHMEQKLTVEYFTRAKENFHLDVRIPAFEGKSWFAYSRKGGILSVQVSHYNGVSFLQCRTSVGKNVYSAHIFFFETEEDLAQVSLLLRGRYREENGAFFLTPEACEIRFSHRGEEVETTLNAEEFLALTEAIRQGYMLELPVGEVLAPYNNLFQRTTL
ncbi:MAG: hypothetical protein FWE69_05465, partial [Clostridiales bacterium]|nr:hypothetical protein [Clostridiales bacterium]